MAGVVNLFSLALAALETTSNLWIKITHQSTQVLLYFYSWTFTRHSTIKNFYCLKTIRCFAEYVKEHPLKNWTQPRAWESVSMNFKVQMLSFSVSWCRLFEILQSVCLAAQLSAERRDHHGSILVVVVVIIVCLSPPARKCDPVFDLPAWRCGITAKGAAWEIKSC